MALRFRAPVFQAFDANGNPVPAALLYFYQTGTSTPRDTFTTSDLDPLTPNENPVVADAGGVFPDIWLADGAYKAILRRSLNNDGETPGAILGSWDPIEQTAATENLVRSITATDTLVTSDNTKLLAVTTSGGIVTLNLLASSVAGNGFTFSIRKDSSDNPLILVPSGAETFWSGESQIYLGPNESAVLHCTGSSWILTGGPATEPGSLKDWGATTTPAGWLPCYGQAISRTVYARLFALYGALYGAGDGVTTFALPDYRGRVKVGRDNMGGDRANIAQASATLTTTNTSNSATVGSASGLTVGSYALSTNVPAGTSITAISGTTVTLSQNAIVTGADASAHFSLINDPEMVGRAGGTQVNTQSIAQLAAHGHASHQHLSLAAVGAGGINVLSSVDVTNTGSTGSSQPISNMQPSAIVNVLIKI